MSLVFKIGENSDIPPVPQGFPQCGNWVPDHESVTSTTTEHNTQNTPTEHCSSTDNTLITRILHTILLEDKCKPSFANNITPNKSFTIILFTSCFVLLKNTIHLFL